MPNEKSFRPFTAFNFEINLLRTDRTTDNEKKNIICNAAFSECAGLEMNLAPKTIREGGNNCQQIHLPGPVTYGQLSLKRGMTDNFDLWTWFEDTQKNLALRANGDVIMFSSNQKPRIKEVKFSLTGCIPIKIKAPGFNAKDGQIAIEEMQIAYETLFVERIKK